MTFLGALRDVRNLSIEDPRVPISGASLIDFTSGPLSDSGVVVSEKSALGMSAVWRAVTLIAQASSSLPLHPYRSDNGDPRPVLTGQAADLLSSPHPDMTPFELWEQVYAHLLLWGNAYLLCLRNPLGQVAELWPLHPSRVVPGRSGDGTKVYQLDGDLQKGYTDREILHIPGFGYDGVAGLSPIRVARQSVGLALAAESFGSRLFSHGSLATGILRTEQRLTQEQADTLKQRWKDKSAGLQAAHDTVVLDAGAQFQQLTIPPEDAQFIETRRFQIAEVARLYGIPPHMMMDTDRSTSWGTGIEQQGIGFVVHTLRPWLIRVEQRLTRLLRPAPIYAKYTVEGLLRGDTAARYASYAVGRQWGWLSANDIRALEEMPPIPDGDGYIQPMNHEPLGTPAPQPASNATEEPANA